MEEKASVATETDEGVAARAELATEWVELDADTAAAAIDSLVAAVDTLAAELEESARRVD
jgi:hypothetical protein